MTLVQPGMNLKERIKQHVMFEFGHGVVTVEVLEPWIDQAKKAIAALRLLEDFSKNILNMVSV